MGTNIGFSIYDHGCIFNKSFTLYSILHHDDIEGLEID